MRNKELVAVDVDEVLFPFVAEFAASYNRRYGTDFSSDDFFTYKFEQVLGLTVPETIRRVYNFNSESHDHISPLTEAPAALTGLLEKYDLTVVTARHPQFESGTKAWLDRYFAHCFTSVNFIGYAEIMEKPRTKLEVCRELGAVALIDDSPHHVSQCAEAGLEGVLFGDYPWNQAGGLPAGVTRCKDWPAVLEYFDGRS